MAQLIIQEDDGKKILLTCHLGKVDHKAAAVAVLEALAKLEPTKKPRSDKGKPRAPKLPISANGQ
jgi:hypothetical protein